MKKEPLVKRMQDVMLHALGDVILCPHCLDVCLPSNPAMDDLWELYKDLFGAVVGKDPA